MTLTIIGAMTEPLMTRPTAPQLVDARAGKGIPVAGAHSIGGIDCGPGMPVTTWTASAQTTKRRHDFVR